MARVSSPSSVLTVDNAFSTFWEKTPYGKGDGTIKHVTCPCAFTMGQNDAVVPNYMVMDNYNALRANSVLLPYLNCGHSPMVDCLDQMAKDVEEFFTT